LRIYIPEGIEAQTRACIENVRVILEDAGSSLEKVVDVTVFLTNMDRDFAAFNRVYGEYFSTIQPTRTTVGVGWGHRTRRGTWDLASRGARG
jgi:2-aminomuconate deaminase